MQKSKEKFERDKKWSDSEKKMKESEVELKESIGVEFSIVKIERKNEYKKKVCVNGKM